MGIQECGEATRIYRNAPYFLTSIFLLSPEPSPVCNSRSHISALTTCCAVLGVQCQGGRKGVLLSLSDLRICSHLDLHTANLNCDGRFWGLSLDSELGNVFSFIRHDVSRFEMENR
jgi:hypothetical protein